VGDTTTLELERYGQVAAPGQEVEDPSTRVEKTKGYRGGR
jgi:hypothetical protein